MSPNYTKESLILTEGFCDFVNYLLHQGHWCFHKDCNTNVAPFVCCQEANTKFDCSTNNLLVSAKLSNQVDLTPKCANLAADV